MAALLDYKCPACGGALSFDSGIQKMKCPYCDTEFDVEALREQDEALKQVSPEQEAWEPEGGQQWQEGETEGLRVYICNSCGGEIVGDETMAATTCPYCDNPVVMSGQFAGDLKPDLVIPFKLDKQAAKDALKRHLSGKPLLSKLFTSENRLESIKGLYVPVWLFDAGADADIRYKATRIRTWSDSRFNYTQTSHFSIHRAGSLEFAAIPVDGSTKMADELMESIEPFDISQAVDFQTAYLAGYLADRYDVSAEQSKTRADQRIKTSTEQALAATVHGYNSVVPVSSNVQVKNAKIKYALYPVWVLSTKYKDKNYLFAMNGQTGKFVGNLPISWGRFFAWWGGLTAGIGVLVTLFGLLTGML